MDFFNNLVLNSENLKRNLKIIKKTAGNKKICAMVKANAYGHNLKFVVLNLKNDVDFFGVANSSEALQVRQFARKNKILVCGKVDKTQIKHLLENNIALSVFSLKSLQEILSVCKSQNLKAFVHLKLNTGMNRMGIKSKSVMLKALKIIHKYKNFVVLEGIYSHLFNSENLGLTHTQYHRFLSFLNCINIYNNNFINQNKNKQKIGKFIKNRTCKLLNVYAKQPLLEPQKPFNFKNLIIHLENSAGLFNGADYLNVCTMARVGIALYGLEIKNKGLKPVLSLTSKIVQIQKVKCEDYCGYGKTIIENDGKVAVVPIGYADGIIRSYKNYFVEINNTYCKILNVCMDSILVDVSSVSAVVGDAVTIISSKPKQKNCANNIAQHLGTISYEVVTNLNHSRLNKIFE